MAAILVVQGCANNVPSEQMAAYSIATGFLTLCDDSDYDYALSHFAKPLKASPAGPNWVKDMGDHRANYGIPVLRSLVARDGQTLGGAQNEPARINFVFRTSFLGTTPGEESVYVERVEGKWQVYDYKFHPSGKPPAHKGTLKIKKTWEEQNDNDDG